MQDGATSHTANPVKAFLIQTFGEDRIVSRRWRYPWPPRLPDLTPADFWFEDVLVPEDPRDVIYTKTRHRTPSTDQSSRGPPHRKKCTRTANCFIGRPLDTGCTSLGTPVPSRTIRRHLAEGHLGSRRLLRVLPLTPTYRHLRLEWCRARGNWTAAEWNQIVFSDESRINLSSDDNHVRV
ncbi:uncharacterized protein TNCV_2678401 [Trichonephila clavipes]|nr:uncharacterized protein TNCV_2678401 [Trichonephila clavipes]